MFIFKENEEREESQRETPAVMCPSNVCYGAFQGWALYRKVTVSEIYVILPMSVNYGK